MTGIGSQPPSRRRVSAAGLASAELRLDCAGGGEPVAGQVRGCLEAQGAVALEDELGVVAGQGEHDGAFALGLVMRAGHRLRQRLVRHFAHLLQDGLAAGDLALVVGERDRRRVAGDE